jgi:hypothetical protein
MTDVGKYRDSLEGPRWAGIVGFLLDMEVLFDVNVRIIHVENRLLGIRQKVHFEITGDVTEVEAATSALITTREKYNESEVEV